MIKTPKYRFLVVEQSDAAGNWRHIVTIAESSKPGAVLRAYHYRRALDEGTTMAAIWGDARPVRVRACTSKGVDILTLGEVEAYGRALYALENDIPAAGVTR
jgi:hypothetical protein